MTPYDDSAGDLATLVARCRAEQDSPWRFSLGEEQWRRDMLACLMADPSSFVGMWCDGVAVFAMLALRDGQAVVFSTPVEMRRYWGLSCACPAAVPHERVIHDLWGVEALDARDLRPWLDHGVWGVTWPLAEHPVPVQAGGVIEFPEIAEVARAGGTICEYGPADGGFHTPAYLRLAVPGARVIDAQWWMGYAHRGICAGMRGRSPAQALRLAGRIDAAATVAHQAALARAMESATARAVDGQTIAARVVFAEMERVASTLFDIAAVANVAGDLRLARACERAREHVQEFCAMAFGSRMLMDVVAFGHGGTVASGFSPHAETFRQWLHGTCAALEDLYRRPRGLGGLARGLGILSPDMARQLGVSGVVAHASAREGDARQATPGYHDAWIPAGVEQAGDVDARMRMRLVALRTSLRILGEVKKETYAPPARAPVPPAAGEGLGWAEGPRGTVRYWVRMEEGQVRDVGICDPALAHMLASEVAMRGAYDTDMAVIMRSFGLSAAGADL
ncbi:NADH-quinone oxidoreductase subunit D-related protein [Novacetimonas pomaceti]|uniref:Ni Fe-hydrogenase III large subunit-like protein n=1 Tax=Novacetimonas pomaceti TaxID=2021998 RepID=A0ABX5P6V3_9PROT|nr:Ni Fe-hydrogenase III large subunit-like protein [Novacetimonas pomaceti]PYD47653.1 Ni Fe-hydrogenase III large subunit-like protein [Novacetimonas pomaceti]